MKKRYLAAAIALILLLCVLCACDPPQEETEDFSVTGIILCEGFPLPDVCVSVNEEPRIFSGEDGVYLLKGLSKGDVIEFEKEGYSFEPASFTVSNDAFDCNTTATTETEYFSASGIILCENLPLPDVRVCVNGELRAMSEADGKYTLDRLNKGDAVAFEKDGYSFEPASFTVLKDAFDRNIAATAVSEPPGETEEPDPPLPPVLAPVNAGFDTHPDSVFFTFAAARDTDFSVVSLYDGDALLTEFSSDSPVPLGMQLSVRGSFTASDTVYDIYALLINPLLNKSLDITAEVACVYKDKTSDKVSAHYKFTPKTASASELEYKDGILSWKSAYFIYNDNTDISISYYVMINSVIVHKTQSCSVDLSAYSSMISSGADVRIRSVADGCPYADSAPLIL